MNRLVSFVSVVVVGAMLAACTPSLSSDQKKLAEHSLQFAEKAVKVIENADSSEQVEEELKKLLVGDAKAGFEFEVKAEGVDSAELTLTGDSLALNEWKSGDVKARVAAVEKAIATAGKTKGDNFAGPNAKRLWKLYVKDGSQPTTGSAAKPEPTGDTPNADQRADEGSAGEANTDNGEANTDNGEANTDNGEANTDNGEANTDNGEGE